MKKKRYLTKSRYKLALECPTKLYYTKKADKYEDQSLNNDFLKAIAKGGFQVGELAKCYFPDGNSIESLDYEEALNQTNKLLEQENVTIFEPAIAVGNLFIRVDILEKKGNQINLIEVKAKSTVEDEFFSEIKNGNSKTFKIKKDWKKYIYDVAFQTYVARQFNPSWQVTPYLMLTDKSKVATVDGLNQKFLLKEVDGRTHVDLVGDVTPKALGEQILCQIPVSEVVDNVLSDQEFSGQVDGLGFKAGIKHYAKMYDRDEKITAKPLPECKKCQFRSSSEDMQSGFYECWNELGIINEKNKDGPFCFDIWFSPKLADLLEDKSYFMKGLTPEDIAPKKITDKGVKFSRYDRQCLQIKKVNENDDSPETNTYDLKKEIDSWNYPLHFIDFETSRVAIPFNKGRKPYEQIAFQFSHHQVDDDGKISHKGEYLEVTPGKFPNFDFVRALKKELENDNGTVFRYSPHENTVLCDIHRQLSESEEADKDDLMVFTESLTSKKEGKGKDEVLLWSGDRLMVDLCKVAEWYYYSPLTGGSLSLKFVLPAILKESDFLKNKYSKAVYGTEWGIPSKNFEKKKWLEVDSEGEVVDPYKQLPPVFNEYDRVTLDTLLMGEDELRNGGAAMTAYAMMQFSEMTDVERDRLKQALLKYCELDTLAMVMLWEHWSDLVHKAEKVKSA